MTPSIARLISLADMIDRGQGQAQLFLERKWTQTRFGFQPKHHSDLSFPKWRTNALFGLLRGSFILAVTLFFAGCQNGKAPEPVENPNPTVHLHIRVGVENPIIDDLRVHSAWIIKNFGCAPVDKFTGHLRVGTPNLPEKVTKIAAGKYVVDVRMDRYIDDNCHWALGGLQFNFMRGPEVFSSYAPMLNAVTDKEKYEIICLPRTKWPGFCVTPEHLNATDLSKPGKFGGLIEVLP